MTANNPDDTSGADAPSAVALIRDFVNTVDYDEETDVLTTPAELSAFLCDADLLSRRTPASDTDLETALRLRAGLREALADHESTQARILPDLDAVLAGLPMRLHWAAGSPSLVPAAGGVPGALAQIAVAVADAIADDTWSRLKICADDGCAWAYYDTSKNRSRNWCGLSCGNKAKTRAYRARHQQD